MQPKLWMDAPLWVFKVFHKNQFWEPHFTNTILWPLQYALLFGFIKSRMFDRHFIGTGHESASSDPWIVAFFSYVTVNKYFLFQSFHFSSGDLLLIRLRRVSLLQWSNNFLSNILSVKKTACLIGKIINYENKYVFCII